MEKTKNSTAKPKVMKLKFSVLSPTIKALDLTKIFDQSPFAKFLEDQNIIAFQLSRIIKVTAGFPDKKFTDWLERKTLGELVQIFKSISKSFQNKIFKIHQSQKYTTRELIKDLK